MKYILVWLPWIFLMAWQMMNTINFNTVCGGHLVRAANANTVELAAQELATALEFMESNRMTHGTTGVIFNYPKNDVGFWYTNIKSSHEELVALPEDATPLEKSNMLMKLRETLLDDGEDGQTLTMPEGIVMFPNNVPFFVFSNAAIFGAIGLCLVFAFMPTRPRRVGWQTYAD